MRLTLKPEWLTEAYRTKPAPDPEWGVQGSWWTDVPENIRPPHGKGRLGFKWLALVHWGGRASAPGPPTAHWEAGWSWLSLTRLVCYGA